MRLLLGYPLKCSYIYRFKIPSHRRGLYWIRPLRLRNEMNIPIDVVDHGEQQMSIDNLETSWGCTYARGMGRYLLQQH